MNPQVRLECYAAIKDCMRTRIVKYFEQNKDLLVDVRAQAVVKEALDGLECIYSVLDKYEIRPKGTGK